MVSIKQFIHPRSHLLESEYSGSKNRSFIFPKQRIMIFSTVIRMILITRKLLAQYGPKRKISIFGQLNLLACLIPALFGIP
jgi:hypothetical protein